MEVKTGKLVIFSAPSGSGKSSIINEILKCDYKLEFSISATTRKPRGEEKDGIHYHFLSSDEFKDRIAKNQLLEWEEVYENVYYGTLKSEVDRICNNGKNVILDIDVVGGLNVKDIYGERALSIFIKAPSIEELEDRLKKRATDSEELIKERIAKAEEELAFAPKFDKIVVNNELPEAIECTKSLLDSFLK